MDRSSTHHRAPHELQNEFALVMLEMRFARAARVVLVGMAIHLAGGAGPASADNHNHEVCHPGSVCTSMNVRGERGCGTKPGIVRDLTGKFWLQEAFVHESFGRCKLSGTCRALGLVDAEFEVCQPPLSGAHAHKHASTRARPHTRTNKHACTHMHTCTRTRFSPTGCGNGIPHRAIVSQKVCTVPIFVALF